MDLKKKYKTPQFGPIGDKAWEKVKEQRKMESEYKVKNRPSQNFGKVDAKTNSQPDLSPYTKPKGKTEVKATPKKYRSLEPAVDYPVYDSVPNTTTTPSTNSTSKKEIATGNLSTKSSTTSNDRMSWAREAERKARKLMGGKD